MKILGMPALWASTDAKAEFNGTVQGYADAMQDMAEAFKDDGLDRKPLREWPAIPEPQPHISGNLPTMTSQEFWEKGQRKGCRKAYLDILKLEANPIVIDSQVKGKPIKVKINGKVSLRGAWVSTKGEAGVKVVDFVREDLRKKGKSYPVS